MLKNKKYFIFLNWFLVVFWMGLIFYLSSISSFPVHFSLRQYNITSSLVHVFLYMILTWLSIRAFISSGIPKARAFFYGFFVSVLYGIGDEFHQMFVVGREAHLSDWLLDLAGSWVILSFYTYRYRNKIKK